VKVWVVRDSVSVVKCDELELELELEYDLEFELELGYEE
jgi:hypothetical protein